MEKLSLRAIKVIQSQDLNWDLFGCQVSSIHLPDEGHLGTLSSSASSCLKEEATKSLSHSPRVVGERAPLSPYPSPSGLRWSAHAYQASLLTQS